MNINMESEVFVCRTCLASSVKLYKLNEPFTRSMGGYDVQNEMKVSFAECLSYCTRLIDIPNFPNYICEECSHALQIAYYFIWNAQKAHEILAQRIGITHPKQDPSNEENDEAVMRFRCKICNEKVGTKKALKEHIKLHMDVITYCCQLCDYDCKKRSQLNDHYRCDHNVEASTDQLKPYMQPGSKTEEIKNEMELQIDEILIPSEQRQKEQEEAERLLQELEEKLLKEQQDKQQKQQQLPLEITEEIKSENNILVNTVDVLSADLSSLSAANISENFENDVSVGNEFMVLPDGTVQKVVGSDVVIEYINEDANGVTVINNNLILENVVQMDPNNTNLNSMDFEDIIEEATSENAEFQETLTNLTLNINQEESQELKSILQLQDERPTQSNKLKGNTGKTFKKVQCKICSKAFQTQSELKIHMLGHNEIPHFFCDRCSFYTFFKKDLTQHFRTQHNIQPSQSQLQPSNNPEPLATGRAIYTCDLCLYETTVRGNLKRHYTKEHRIQATEIQLRPTIDDTDIDIKGYNVNEENPDDYIPCTICKAKFYSNNKYKEHMLWHKTEDAKKEEKPQAKKQNNAQENIKVESVISNPEETTSNNINEMILPMDEVPQVVESEQTIEHTVNFDFNGDEIFEDFDDNNESIGEGEDDEDLGELLLTSEDDLNDLLEEHGNDDLTDNSKTKPVPQLPAYCVHCNKRFFSQYHFENHMFIHRGLAPYRCEMCTNLYNTKRALIRHYKAVHKTIPTRDMIQAKGDKVNVDKTPIEHLNMDGAKNSALMCANCPFESNDRNNLLLHLSSIHGTTDDNYILQKLPFECPRCIRSYESKVSLMRHLERSHSVATIIHQFSRQTSPKKSSLPNSLTEPSITNATASNRPATSPRSGIVESSLKQTSTNAADVEQEIYDDKVGITFLEKNVEIRQKLSQEKVPTFECSICQGKYKSQTLLRHHIKRHVERKFLCDLCPKSFISRNDLDKHKLLHAGQATGQMPYKCDMCHKQFGYPHHLKRHKDVIHYGKRYTCPVPACGRTFTSKGQYNIHKWSHSGNLPYKCKICCRFFNKREPLRQHSRKVHNINLTEAEIAEIYRENMGHTNPHDLIVALNNGQMLRRSEAEAITQNTMEAVYNEDGVIVCKTGLNINDDVH